MFDRLFGRAAGSVPTISPREAWERVSTGKGAAVLIDVREVGEFARGHAKGARNVPLSQFNRRFKEIPTTKEVLLICQSGHRSMQAAQMLKAQGYEQVWNVSGGTSVWHMSRLPME